MKALVPLLLQLEYLRLKRLCANPPSWWTPQDRAWFLAEKAKVRNALRGKGERLA